MEVDKFLRLPDSLLVEILSQWVSLKDFASLDSALCNKEARKTFQQFLSFQSLNFSNSGLDMAKNQMPVWRAPGDKIGRRNLYLPFRFCAKRNIRVDQIALRSWPFFDMEPESWWEIINSTATLSLSVIEQWQLITQLGWSCFFSEFRSFSNVRKLIIESNDLSFMSTSDISVNEILTAAQEQWKHPLEALSLSFGTAKSLGTYGDGSFVLSMKIDVRDLSAWENLRSLKLDGSWLMFINNSDYFHLLSNLASLQSGALETISLDCEPSFMSNSVRPIMFALQNTRALLEQPQEKLSGLRNLKSIEGVDAFIYPMLFIAPKLEHVRILVGDKFLMGMARHSPTVPFRLRVLHHNYDAEDDLEDESYYEPNEVIAPADQLQADPGHPWGIPRLSHVKTFHLTIDGRRGMMNHSSFPIILGPFFRESGMLSTVEKLNLRMSIAADVVRCDVIEFFHSVAEGRTDGRLPPDACLKLRTLEVADFLYLCSSFDKIIDADFDFDKYETPSYPIQDLMDEHSTCKFIADAAPNLTELAFHPERDRENALYHQRRFRVQSILSLAKQLTSLHVDEVFRVQVPRLTLRNQFSLLTSFEKLQHLTLRDSGLFFSDEELIPVLKALPGLITLVLAVDNFLITVMESVAEYRQLLRRGAEIEFNDVRSMEYGGSPGCEIKYSVNPSGNITTKTLRTIMTHNTRLRVLLLDIPCHPEDEMESLADATASMALSDTASTTCASVVDPLDQLARNAHKHTPESRMSSIEPVLFDLWKSLPHIKTRDQLYVRVEPRHYGPDLWENLFTTEKRHALSALRTQRWQFCRDLRTSLLARYEAWKAQSVDNRRPFAMEVMKCPLFLYRYETRSGQQFIDTHGDAEEAQAVNASNQEGYENAAASAQEQEPFHEYDDGDSEVSSYSGGSDEDDDDSHSSSDNDEVHSNLDEDSHEDDEDDGAEWETDDGDEEDEDEGEWSDIDEGD